MTAGYGQLKNSGPNPINVEFVSVEKFKAGEFDETITLNGLSEMRHLKSLKLSAGQTLRFEPGGSNLMLYNPIGTFKVGDAVTVTLKVDGKTATYQFKIVSRSI